jgi:DNA invertase Pin-like site-specific DNA recombinase
MAKTTIGPRCAAVYVRVSTEEQAELSPETQLEKIREYAAREGIVILEDHIYIDPGISGKKAEKRPQFMRMISAAKEKDCPFTVLLLWKFSRFARNQEEAIFYKSILRSKCGVDVVSITEPLIAGHFGSLIERIIEWMDEFYSIRLGEEVKRSMEANARRGKLQAIPSFGYTAKDGRLVPEPEEALIIQRIFNSFLAGKGLFPIAKELNAMGIRTHRGNMFENRTIEYILRNPVYIGKLRWNPAGHTRRDFSNENIIIADSDHEPLVDVETWEAAQKRLDEVKAKWGYKARPTNELKHWLSGIVRCNACGSTLTFSHPHYYKCNSFVRGRCKHSQHIRADLLAEALIGKLAEDATTAQDLACEIVYTNSSGGDDLARMEASLRQLQIKKSRLQEAYLAGVMELADFAATKKELDADLEQIQQEIQDFHQRADERAVKAAIQTAIGAAVQTLKDPSATLEQKNNAARSVIDTCTFDKSSYTLTISYSIVL